MNTSQSLAGSRVLLTNDDGLDAPGIKLLEEIVREFTDDVWIVAPDHERSGAGHSVSLHIPIRLRRISDKRYSVIGTPTDCVLMAFNEIMTDRRPDIVLSGINNGANLAEDVTYSGTIAAAMEGTLMGVRSIALSVVRPAGAQAEWDGARKHASELLRQLLATDHWPPQSFININFPDCAVDEISGVRVTRQGLRPPGTFTIEPRIDARNVPYFWVRIAYGKGESPSDSDLRAIEDNAISVTPIQMDFTDYDWQRHLQGLIK